MFNNEAEEVMGELVHTAQTWFGPLPPDLHDHSLPWRLHGAAFSVLVMIDGGSGPGMVSLTPKPSPEVELAGRSLHELFGSDHPSGDPHEQQLLDRMQTLVTEHTSGEGTLQQVINRFMWAVLVMLAEHYQLRLVDTDDDTGEPTGASDNVLPQLLATARTRLVPR